MPSSLVVPYGSVRGVQRARISTVPPYASSSGDEAIKIASLAGIELDPWQRSELVDAMGESSDWKCPQCTFRVADREPCPAHPRAVLLHPWAAFEVCSVVPRQNGKSQLLIARILAGLFLLEEPLQIYSAHQFDTAMEIFHRLVAVVENTPDLLALVKLNRGKVGIYSHGSEGITLKSGHRVRFKARTGGGGRGFTCHTLYLDEAMILPERFLGATVPTLSAISNPQIWLAGSAPDEDDPTHDGVVLAKRRMRALAGGDRSLVYFEHSAEGDHPDRVGAEVLDDPAQRALANPAFGIRITPEYVENERAAMGARQFAVERLGITVWPDVSEDARQVIPRELWADLKERDRANRITSCATFAVDTNLDQSWGSIGIAGQRDDGLWQVAVVKRAEGKDWIVGAALDLREEYPSARFVIDPRSPAANLIKEFRDAGIEPVEVSTQEYGDACADFVAAAVERELRYPFPQPELDGALSGAEQQKLGDRWKWARRSSASADISPLVAVTLALWGARNADSEFTTLLVADPPSEEDRAVELGPQAPTVIGPEDYTSCFRCATGSFCPVHSNADEGGE